MHARWLNRILRECWTRSNSLFTDHSVKSLICYQYSLGSCLSWPLSASLLQHNMLATALQSTSSPPSGTFVCMQTNLQVKVALYTDTKRNLFMELLSLLHVVHLCSWAGLIFLQTHWLCQASSEVYNSFRRCFWGFFCFHTLPVKKFIVNQKFLNYGNVSCSIFRNPRRIHLCKSVRSCIINKFFPEETHMRIGRTYKTP